MVSWEEHLEYICCQSFQLSTVKTPEENDCLGTVLWEQCSLSTPHIQCKLCYNTQWVRGLIIPLFPQLFPHTVQRAANNLTNSFSERPTAFLSCAFRFILILCVRVCLHGVYYVYWTYAWCPRRPAKGIRSTETGVTEGCELWYTCWNLGPA